MRDGSDGPALSSVDTSGGSSVMGELGSDSLSISSDLVVLLFLRGGTSGTSEGSLVLSS